MSYSLEDLILLKKNEIKSAALMFAKTFHNDPLAMWLFPQEEDRLQKLVFYFRFRIKYGVLFGEVYTTSPNLEGLAVWLPSQYVEMTNWRNFLAGGMPLLLKLGKDIIEKMTFIGNFTYKIHLRHANFPHWYLAPIGVNPEYQGQGYASRLMRAMLKRLDEENLPCFLETQSKTNVEIYKHYDFEVVEKTVIPKANLDHWAMLRKPSKQI